MKKHILLPLVFVTTATLVALTAMLVQSNASAVSHRQKLEYTYRRAFCELTDHVSAMESALEKASYAGTPTQQAGIAARLMEQASGAKAALSALPLREDTLETVQKFLTQAEDFSASINNKVSAGKQLSEEDHTILRQLYDYASLLYANLAMLQQTFEGQDLAPGESTDKISTLTLEKQPQALSDRLADTAVDFKDYPTLLYDGPFSDHISQQKPKFLEGKETVSPETALANAAKFFGVSASSLSQIEDSNGNLPAYHFKDGTKRIAVTMQGGIVQSLLDSRTVESSNLNYENAKEKASAFLKENGFGDFSESYYVIHDNCCTIQFFAQEQGVLLYPDLIKVTVALDNGEIVGYDGTGYLMNHHSRSLSAPKLSQAEAAESVSKRLTIDKATLTLVPKNGNEVLCYEFLCTGDNEEEVLVYINGDTGLEEQILLLQRSDGGILTR